MMKRISVVGVALVMALATTQIATAKGKPTVSPTAAAKGNKSTSSAWLVPKTASTTSVRAGAAIALKFRLASGDGTEIKSTSGLTVAAAAVDCPVPTPAPSAATTPQPRATGTLAVLKQGKSEKVKSFRYSGKSFVYLWKTSKSAMLGCYQFSVTGTGVSLPNGPIVQIVAAE